MGLFFFFFAAAGALVAFGGLGHGAASGGAPVGARLGGPGASPLAQAAGQQVKERKRRSISKPSG